MNILNSPHITVVITTKNRGDILCNYLESIFANEYKKFKVVVVDQSTDEVTKKAISKYLKNPQFTYIKSDSVGSSAGRNIAIENSESELVAITDDVKAFAGSKDVLDIKALTAVGEKLDVKAFKIKGNVFDIKALTPISHFSFYLSHK